MTRIMVVWTLSLLLVASNALAEGWICTVDYSTGFIFKGGRWQSTIFDVENKTLLIRKPIEDNALEKGRDLQWVVTTIGESELATYCDTPVNASGFLHCEGSSIFRFNTNTLRYLHAVTFGYYSATPGEGDGGDTPYMEIGRCSPV